MQPLPIDPLLPEITALIRESQNVILTATPGAGKTTRLPPELLSVVDGRILVLQPRRMAAVAAAARIADERGWRVGGEVGYQVRFDSKVSGETRLRFVTDALAVRQLISDPELKGIGLVVIDEFHERNLHQDLMLGALREMQELGSPVKILIMSATLDTRKLLSFLPGSQHIEVPGKVFPLEIRYAQQALRLQTDNEFFTRMSEACERASRETAGDILVFLPGVGEISRLSERLAGRIGTREIQVLHGSLALQEQQKVLRPSGGPRLILSTNVAEASVTADGVDFVIDCGLHKQMQMGSRTGFAHLELSRIAQFNARQRAGRAARQKEGVCLRMWTPHEEVTQAVETAPEVQRSDLSTTVLTLAHLGVSEFSAFAWLDHPPGPLLSAAVRSLQMFGALDREKRMTDMGRRLLDFPLPPRLGALLALGEKRGVGRLAARAAALLNERDILARLSVTTRLEDDLALRLELLDEFERGQARHLRAQPVLELARQLAGMVSAGSGDGNELRRVILLSQRDRLCRRRGSGERALMVGGRGVRLSPESQVRQSEFFVALDGVDLHGQPDTVISLACGYDKEFVLDVLREHVRIVEDIHFEEERGQFYSRRVRFIDDLPIDEPTLGPVDASAVAAQLGRVLADKWDWLVSRHEGLRTWMQRWKFAGIHDPRFELSAELIKQACEMFAFSRSSLAAVLEQDLVGILESVLDRALVREFHEQVPGAFVAPTGHRHAIDYSETHAAYVDVRLQEMFGCAVTPKILWGRVPLTFRLLGPNYRPVQVTSDIAGFWKSAYIEVRKELRSRYPKHSWPDDPLSAKPEAKGKRRT